MSDAFDDLRADFLARVKPAPSVPAPGTGYHPAWRPIAAQMRRMAGVGDPAAVGGTGLDAGFLLACNDLAPDLFGDLVAWRLGTVADEHATAKPTVVTERSAKGARRMGYVEGVRAPKERETAAQRRDREVAETAKVLGTYRGRQAI